MDYRRAFKISCILAYAAIGAFVATAIVAAVTNSPAPALAMLGITALPAIAALCIRSAYYRCPHCSEELNHVRGSIPKHCPHCGKPLD